MQRGHHLAGVEEALGIECRLERVELGQLGGPELAAHLVDLLDPHAVLARDRAPHLDAELEEVRREGLGALELARRIGVVEDQRMQVAVARVKHVGAAQPVLFRQLAGAAQHMRQSSPRDRAVDAVVVGRDASHCGECGLASRPEAQPLGLALRDANVGGARCAHHRAHLGDLVGHLLPRAVGLGEKYRRRLEVVARVHETLDRAGRELVHHLEAGGHDPAADHARHRIARAFHVCERGHDHLRRLGLGQQLDGSLERDREQALGAVDERQQVVAGRIERFRAQVEQIALDRHCANARHVVDGQAVFEAMHAAGVFRDVAADGAGDLARRIGRVVQAQVRDVL